MMRSISGPAAALMVCTVPGAADDDDDVAQCFVPVADAHDAQCFVPAADAHDAQCPSSSSCS